MALDLYSTQPRFARSDDFEKGLLGAISDANETKARLVSSALSGYNDKRIAALRGKIDASRNAPSGRSSPSIGSWLNAGSSLLGSTRELFGGERAKGAFEIGKAGWRDPDFGDLDIEASTDNGYSIGWMG